MRNIELLEKTMTFIKDNPTKHDQRVWVNDAGSCGTTACFAGWAAMLAGWTAHEVDSCQDIAGEIGANLLGLTFQECRALFYGMNTVDELELMVKELVAGNGIHNPNIMLDTSNPLF